MEYVAYSDESYTGERYRSIASFSLLSSKLGEVNDKLHQKLSESSVDEFKWKKLKDAKYRFCALKLISVLWSILENADARIDVVVWDTQDSRHSVPNRDDIKNQERMFYHLHLQSLRKRPKNSVWYLYPDEMVELDWDGITYFLQIKGKQREFIDMPLFGSFFADPHYNIIDLKQVQSHNEPCCQMADLFAGLAVFSRTHYDQYSQWLSKKYHTLSFLPETISELSNRESNRFEVLSIFDNGCKARMLGVSLKSKRCLYTPNPLKPLNFWHYEPQHEKDKAPMKGLR